MPFHVEISSPINQARVFNLEAADLRQRVLDPWVAGVPFQFGGEDFSPRESRLTILEGPALERPGADAGWESAQRAAADVTRPLLEEAEANAPARTAAIVEAGSMAEALKELSDGRAAKPVPWESAVDRVNSRDPRVAAMILVVKPSGWSTPKL